MVIFITYHMILWYYIVNTMRLYFYAKYNLLLFVILCFIDTENAFMQTEYIENEEKIS